MWWFLVVTPATPLLAWWATCTSSIMAAEAQSEIFTLLPPLLAYLLLGRPQRDAVCLSTLYLVEDAGLTVNPSVRQGLCMLELEWMALSAQKTCRQRLSMKKPLPTLHWALQRLHLCQGLHQSCWSAPCAYCDMHVSVFQTSWPVTTVHVQIVFDSISASRSQSPVSTSAAQSALSVSIPMTSKWSWETELSWRSMKSSCWGGGSWLNLTAVGALPRTVGKKQGRGIIKASPWIKLSIVKLTASKHMVYLSQQAINVKLITLFSTCTTSKSVTRDVPDVLYI